MSLGGNNSAQPKLIAQITEFTVLSVQVDTSADLTDTHTPPTWSDVTGLHVVGPDNVTVPITHIDSEDDRLNITVAHELDVRAQYAITVDGVGPHNTTITIPAIAGAVVRTDEFDRRFFYDGNDLGATYAADATSFALWAPTAASVEVVTFIDSSSASAPERDSVPMTYDRGVWRATIQGDIDGTAYIYRVTFANGMVNDSPDPYATAAVVNGHRSVVLAPERVTIDGFARMEPFGGPEDAIIAETHVRDFSISPTSGVSKDHRGRFLGMVEPGTVNSCGRPTTLDYVRELGITHLQLQPIFDFASVDEAAALSDDNYNWGYDPYNYNVPEGSFATDPANPASRIVEAKRMIRGLHEAGLRVIMDVVYNHVFDAADHPFQLTVPGYYFRYRADGTLSSDSCCGNDVASERLMVRQYIVHSVQYWAQQYGLDGFRFDLMGLIDIPTMQQIRETLDAIDPSMIIVGEGWQMCTTLPASMMATQGNAAQLNTERSTISFFNDSMRDALKGSALNDHERGFISGVHGLEGVVLDNMLGAQHIAPYASARQVVQYAEIHDNMTLYDKLAFTLPDDSESVRMQRLMLANAAIMMAHGVAEFQLGQEFGRTKHGDGNSYRSGDRVNAIDWDRMNNPTYGQGVEDMRRLIVQRRQTPQLREWDYNVIARTTDVMYAQDGVVAYATLCDDFGDNAPQAQLITALNANESTVEVHEPDGELARIPALDYLCAREIS